MVYGDVEASTYTQTTCQVLLIEQCSAADATMAALLMTTSACRHAAMSDMQTTLCLQNHFATAVSLQQVCKI